MEYFEIREYDPAWEQAAEEQFVRYAREDLEETCPDKILREKIWRGVFVTGWEKGLLSIALALADGEPAGFVIYQVDSPESDWCKRPGWGLIREFCIAPEFRRRGYGRALAEYAERELSRKADQLYLTAHDEAAVKFWTACGFSETGEVNKNGTRTMVK